MAESLTTIVSSAKKTVEINRENPTVIIGERINPTGRKQVLAAFAAGDFEIARTDALAQVAAGAHMLDVNAGVPGADEPVMLTQVLRTVMEATDVPLCIDTADPVALAAALSIYQGKALVNSCNGEERSLNAVLPIVKEYGAAVIGLCMDDDGIPETPEARLRVAAKIIERAGRLGIPVVRHRDRSAGPDHGRRRQRGPAGAGCHRADRQGVRRQHHHGRQQHLLRHARPACDQFDLHRHGDPCRADLPDHKPAHPGRNDRDPGGRPVHGA